MEYKLVQERTAKELEEKVNELIKDGWQPIGGIAFISTKAIINRRNIIIWQYTQAMIKN